MTRPLRDEKARAVLGADAGLRGLTDAHRKALKLYSGNHFYLIQQRPWETPEAEEFGSVEREFVDRIVRTLDDAFSLLDGPSEDVLVYRGGPAPPADGLMRGYVSSSLNREVAEGIATVRGDLWRITVRAGSRALLLPIVEATHTPEQAEVLIDRNRSFILHSVTARSEHGRILTVEIRP